MPGLAIILEKAKRAKTGSKSSGESEKMGSEPPMGMESSEMESDGPEAGTEELEAMKLFEEAQTTEEKLDAFKMLMKACGS